MIYRDFFREKDTNVRNKKWLSCHSHTNMPSSASDSLNLGARVYIVYWFLFFVTRSSRVSRSV